MSAADEESSGTTMRRVLTGAAGWWDSPARRMAIDYALRGTVAMLVPFVVLLELGLPYGADAAALGGMYAVFADGGGAYRSRTGAMLLSLGVGATSLFVSASLPITGWAASIALAFVAFVAGMARVFGTTGISLGLCASVMYLVGLLSPDGPARAAESAGYYALGSLWVVGFQLVLWRLNPNRLLFEQIAACYESCAALVLALEREIVARNPGVARKRLRRRHQAAREAIRTAQATAEALRLGSGHSTPGFDRVATVIAAVSREAVAAASLRTTLWPRPNTPAAREWRRLLAAWRLALMAVARWVAGGTGEMISTAPMRRALETLEARGALSEDARAPLRLALLHLEAVAEVGERISGSRFLWRDALPRLAIGGLRDAWMSLAAQFGFRSILFRHALRVALAAGVGLWVAGIFNVTHRLWLPMTAILVLQPEFGATWRRLWQRIGGTLAGVLIAGSLHFLVQGSAAEIVLVAVFAFGMFLFIRTNYGIGVVMLTPMVLLLIGILNVGTPASLIGWRGLDTIAGGSLALVAAYLLWPMWERGAYLPQCAKAIRAQRAWLGEVMAQPGDAEPSPTDGMQARHEAELESDNANAILRRMLAEPRGERGDVRAALGLMSGLRRLADTAFRFTLELGGGTLAPDERGAGEEVLQRLDAIAEALEGTAPPDVLARMRPQLAAMPAEHAPLAPWLGRLGAEAATLALAARRLLASDAPSAGDATRRSAAPSTLHDQAPY